MNWRSSSALFHHPRGCGGPWRWGLREFFRTIPGPELREPGNPGEQLRDDFPDKNWFSQGCQERRKVPEHRQGLLPSLQVENFTLEDLAVWKGIFTEAAVVLSPGWRTEIRILSFGRIHLLSLLWCQHIWAGPGQDQGVFISQFSLPKFPCTLLELCLVPDNDHLMATKAFM